MKNKHVFGYYFIVIVTILFVCTSAEEPHETKILRAKIYARMGRDNQVDNLLEKFDLGQSTKIVRAILMRAKRQFSEGLSLIKEFLENSNR